MILRIRFLSVFSFAILALALSGCRSTARLAELPDSRPALFPQHSLGQIRFQMAAVPDTIISYDGRSEVRYESPDVKGSFSLHIRQSAFDTVAVGVSVHRITVARALVTTDSFFVYDRVKKDLYLNSTEKALEHLGMPVTLYDVASNLLGTLQLPTGRGWRVSADTAFYYVSNDRDRTTFTIDPRIWRVIRYEVLSQDGEVLESRTFESFDQFGTAYLPRRIILSRPLDKQHLSMYHRSLRINPEKLNLTFRTSSNPKRVVFP